jgi:hypothetical protein
MSQQKNTGWAEVKTDTQEEIAQQTLNDRVGENKLGYAALTQPTTNFPFTEGHDPIPPFEKGGLGGIHQNKRPTTNRKS